MKRRFELTYVPIGAATKVIFLLNIIIGFVAGLILGLMLAVMSSVGLPMQNAGFGQMSPLAMMAIIPFVYAFLGGIFGTLMSVIFIWMYNQLARFAGGVVLELEEMDSPEGTRPNLSGPSSGLAGSGMSTPPWSMPPNMSSTIGGTADAPYRPQPKPGESGERPSS